MADFLDYDPDLGITYSTSWDDEKGEISIHSVADVEPLLEANKAIAKDGLADRGIKESWWLYARIPNVEMLKMKIEKGIDLLDPGHAARFFKELNENYRYLKTTEKNHGGKPVIIHDLGKPPRS